MIIVRKITTKSLPPYKNQPPFSCSLNRWYVVAFGETVCVVISWLKHIFPLCVDIAPFAVSVIFYVCQPIDKHTSLFVTRIKQPMLVNIDKSLPCKYFQFLAYV